MDPVKASQRLAGRQPSRLRISAISTQSCPARRSPEARATSAS